MMALLFIILLGAVVFAWLGRRSTAMWGYCITLCIAIIWFFHHATDKLTIQL